MSTLYRKEYNKIFKRINKIAQKGSESIIEYKELIDELVTRGQYRLLEDVLITKYGIDISKYPNIEKVKNETFDDIRRVTNFTSQIFLKELTEQKEVYSMGYHYYNKNNNQYLGDIQEVELNPNFSEKKLIEIFIDLEAVVGLSSSIIYAIPTFVDDIRTTVRFDIDAQVLYNNGIYHCIQSYTYSELNRLTPTYSTYWDQVSSPSYSLTTFTGSSTTLLEKYSLAIDTLKSYNYTII
jgi:hypothetical protein